MDLQMPGMGGIKATRHILEAAAEERPHLAGVARVGAFARVDGAPGEERSPSDRRFRPPHVIAMTASVFDEDRQACKQAGMRGFVSKPIEAAELDATVRRVARERGGALPEPRRVRDRIRYIESLGETGFFHELCQLFLSDARLRLPRMKEAAARREGRSPALDAHALKSSSATLGAAEMAELCAQLEAKVDHGHLNDTSATVDAIAARFEEFEGMLTKEMKAITDRPTTSGNRPTTLELS